MAELKQVHLKLTLQRTRQFGCKELMNYGMAIKYLQTVQKFRSAVHFGNIPESLKLNRFHVSPNINIINLYLTFQKARRP